MSSNTYEDLKESYQQVMQQVLDLKRNYEQLKQEYSDLNKSKELLNNKYSDVIYKYNDALLNSVRTETLLEQAATEIIRLKAQVNEGDGQLALMTQRAVDNDVYASNTKMLYDWIARRKE
jgi:chromosome segregation ATPase